MIAEYLGPKKKGQKGGLGWAVRKKVHEYEWSLFLST